MIALTKSQEKKENNRIMNENILFLKSQGYKRGDILLTMDISPLQYHRLYKDGPGLEKRKEATTKCRLNRKNDPHYYLGERIKRFQKKANCNVLFGVQDVLNKFGPYPRCYLTGLPINYDDAKSYHLDHVIPISKGGSGNLDNLEISLSWANQMKSNYPKEDFLEFCRKIVNYSNFQKFWA